MRKFLPILLIFLSHCSPKFQPDKFSFPLEEESHIELKGVPIYFDGKKCITDKGWSAVIQEDNGKLNLKISRNPAAPKITIKNSNPRLRVGEDEYYGTADGWVIRKRRGKIKWKRKIGAAVSARPAIWKNYLFVTSLDGHIYAFKRNTGALLWIGELPGRGKYPPLVIDEIVVAPSLSNKIRGFFLNGKKAGDFKLEGVLKFPLYQLPGKRLAAVVYSWEKQNTLLQILRKKMGVEIELSPSTKINTREGAEIKAKVFGFYSPVITFRINGKILSRGEDDRVLWIPSREGIFKIEVEVEEKGYRRSSFKLVRVISPERERDRALLRLRQSCYWKK